MNNDAIQSIANIRKNYSQAELNEADIQENPFIQFERWFRDAQAAGVEEVNAMALATASLTGRPSVRIVLLKGFDGRGFLFFTNYRSRKGEELLTNPYAGLTFFWKEIERQVRVEGKVSTVSREESVAYFRSRPRESQLGALCSAQSKPVTSRQEMLDRFRELEAMYQEQEIPFPENWGGFLLAPDSFEFWQGRPSRMHDRILYSRAPGGAWQTTRLYP
jgi:pyridoxamine-phosphate oxidase